VAVVPAVNVIASPVGAATSLTRLPLVIELF